MRAAELRQLAEDAMRARGLVPSIPQHAVQEAESMRSNWDGPGAGVDDLRALPWFSIDNDDSRDLDQLSVAEALEREAVRLRVAIADVDAFVEPGSSIDSHAAINTTSVYTAAGVFPMLPEALSTDLSSLNEGRERLALVVDMRVEEDGTVSSAQLYRAAVVNRARLTYNAVSAWLDGDGPLPPAASAPGIEAQLRLHDTVAARLREWRNGRGALNVKSFASRPVFDDGELIDLRPDVKNRAKDLIADLMIAANAATARFLAASGFPSLRRVLDEPRRWDRIAALAARHGSVLSTTPDAAALEHFLVEQRRTDPGGYADLSLAMVKLLGPGQYAAAEAGSPPPGHFGLAVDDYTHATAPNRRFVDLVTHRLVKAALAGEAPPYSAETLGKLARHCTVQEDNAAKVERQVLKAAAAYLLHGRIGETFDALVTGAAPKGTFVRITRPMIEGRLVKGFEGLDVGDTLKVRLAGIDPAQGHIDFEASP